MKGISTEVIIYAVLALAIVGVAFFFLVGKFTTSTPDKGECKSKISLACSVFKATGSLAPFEDISNTCGSLLNIEKDLRACKGEMGQDREKSCYRLCNLPIIQSSE